MKIEGHRYRLWIDPRASTEQRAEAAHQLFRHLIDPPRSVADRRRVAIRTAMAQYEGTRAARAAQLERQLKSYLASGWLRDRDLEELRRPCSTERLLLHRIGRLNAGRSLGRRQLDRIAGPL
jgi:hypothetical protein